MISLLLFLWAIAFVLNYVFATKGYKSMTKYYESKSDNDKEKSMKYYKALFTNIGVCIILVLLIIIFDMISR